MIAKFGLLGAISKGPGEGAISSGDGSPSVQLSVCLLPSVPTLPSAAGTVATISSSASSSSRVQTLERSSRPARCPRATEHRCLPLETQGPRHNMSAFAIVVL